MSLLDGLISYWKLNETSGTRVDSKGSNDLTDNNTVGNIVGVIGNAGNFVQANSEFLSHADNASLSTDNTDFSFSYWVYIPTSSSGADGHVAKYDNNDAAEREYYFLFNTGPNDITFALFKNDGGSNPSGGVKIPSPTKDEFIHIVGMVNNSTLTQTIIMNDGTPVTGTMTETHTNASVTDFTIGNLATPEAYMDGRIDEVGFWKRALTAAEITQLYNGGAGLSYPFSSPVFESTGIGRMPGYLSFGRRI